MPGRGLPPGPAQVGLYGQIPRELLFRPWTSQIYQGPSFIHMGVPTTFPRVVYLIETKITYFASPGVNAAMKLTACARPGLPPPRWVWPFRCY